MAHKDHEPQLDEDDDDLGPMPEPAEVDTGGPKKKKRRVLEHEALYLSNLPSADMYEKSLMHRDVVNFVVTMNPYNDFLVTTSVDGHVKFWKKTQKGGIEFVKHYRAHLGPVVAVASGLEGSLFASCGADKAIKIFDVINFDMINILKLDYFPRAAAWCSKKTEAQALLVCTDLESPNIHVYNAKEAQESVSKVDVPLFTSSELHSRSVHIVQYNPIANVLVSVDDGGMMEYSQLDLERKSFTSPKVEDGYVGWEYKADTDLYEFKKTKSIPCTLTFSQDFSKFATFSFDDRHIRIFSFRSGKLVRKYDESLSVVSEMQQAGTAIHKLDDMEFGRRLALEKELVEKGRGGSGGQTSTANVVFDESGHFIIYAGILGIKVVNTKTNRVSRLVGKMDNQRFLNIALYQGAPNRKAFQTTAMAASDNSSLREAELLDPTIFATAYKRNRFYLLTQRDPDYSGETTAGTGTSRDIFNEKPSREEQTVASSANVKQSLGSQAVIHTSMGDIHVRLFPEHAPKAVENFVGLAKKGYYDNVLFHRVIDSFMIQTGDPLGDGTGGDSLWGHEFEDEFTKALKHDRPYTLSMANCGPNTNASQFFITTVPTPWLDNKHTIFGRATGGMDVVHRIEKTKTDKSERPLEDVKILGIEVR